jgi:hypothetical protein
VTKPDGRSDVPIERIESAILFIRGHKVMLDRDLAALYGVKTFNLNKAVKRNTDRFPEDFMFQLTAEEAGTLRFQIGMSKGKGRGGRRYLPYVFTEQGVAMLSSVLQSKRAVQVNVEIIRAFVRLRQMLAPTKIWPESSLLWKRNTIPSLGLFSRRCGSSWPHQRPRNARSGFW